MQVIEIDSSDDIVSVCDRLGWAAEQRVVLVLPLGGEVLRRPMELMRLQRCADGLRIDVGLVIEGEEALVRRARGLGIPVFGSVTAARRARRGRHWRPRRQEQLGLLSNIGWEWPEHPTQRVDADWVWLRRRWYRLSVILLVVLFVAGALLAMALTVPRGIIFLHPVSQAVGVKLTFTADPAQTTANPANGIIPAQLITDTLSWSGEMDIDGVVTAADRERLHAQAMVALETAAPGEIVTRLPANLLLLDRSLRVVGVQEESYSAAEGTAADSLAIYLRATVEATVVEAALVNGVVYQGVLASLPEGFELLPESLQVGEVEMLGEDAEGQFIFVVDGRAVAAATVDIQPHLTAVRGRPLGDVVNFLAAELPLQDAPVVTLRPAWWAKWVGRLPFRTEQIEVRVVD